MATVDLLKWELNRLDFALKLLLGSIFSRHVGGTTNQANLRYQEKAWPDTQGVL